MLNLVLPDVFGTDECSWAARKHHHATYRNDEPDLRIHFHFFGGTRQRAAVLPYLLSSSCPVFGVPLVIVVPLRVIWNIAPEVGG